MNTFLWLFLNLFLFSLKPIGSSFLPRMILLIFFFFCLSSMPLIKEAAKGPCMELVWGFSSMWSLLAILAIIWLTRALVGAFIGSNRMNVFADRMPTYMILTALVTLLLGVVRGLFLCVMLHRWMPFVPFALWTLRSIGWNLIMAPLVWVIYQKVKERFLRRHSYYYHL